MGVILKFLVIAILLGGLGLVGFSYVGDLSPDTAPVTVPVELNAD